MNLTNPIFQDANKARKHLEQIRWPNGPICPHCGEVGKAKELEGKSHREGLFKCYSCCGHFTVTVGTVFEKSKIPLNKWILAAHLLAASKKGYSAHQLHRTIGVSYKTAWFMMHRLREAMKPQSSGLLGSNGGTVEADETFWGNNDKQRKGARGYAHKMKVFSLVERQGEKRSFVVSNVNAKTLRPILNAHVSSKANMMTDEMGAYRDLKADFASHEIVTHSKREYVRGKAHTNTVECSFSLLKRGLIGTFHKVGEQHLQRYVTEFDFRWNYRSSMGYNDSQRALELLKNVHNKRLRYY